MVDRHAQYLEAAQRASYDGPKPFDSEMVEQSNLDVDHVANANDRKICTEGSTARGIDEIRTGRSATAAEDIRTDDIVVIRVDRLARSDENFPPARIIVSAVPGHVGIATQRVTDQNCILAIRTEAAPRLETDSDFGESATTFEFQRLRRDPTLRMRQRRRTTLVICTRRLTHIDFPATVRSA
jgi:hypothetical protein